jgi:hypothetical protein
MATNKLIEKQQDGIRVSSVAMPKKKVDINVWYAKFTPWHYEQLIQD